MTEYYTAQLQQQMLAQVTSMAVWVGIMVMAVVLLAAVASYVLESVGIYCIARRRGLKHPWLAWIPVLNAWLLGSVSDQYRYVVKGQIRNNRLFMLILSMVSVVLGWVSTITFAGNAKVLAEALSAQYPGYGTGALITSTFLTALTLVLAGLIVGIAGKVLRYMSLYDLYASCDKKNDVLYLVLSILFDFLTPVLLFLNRNKDEGMPPRRQAPAAEAEEFVQV